MKNSIMVVVAQRVSTVMDADTILVLDEGQLRVKEPMKN